MLLLRMGERMDMISFLALIVTGQPISIVTASITTYMVIPL